MRRLAQVGVVVGGLVAALGIARAVMLSDLFWRNPLANARFRVLTEFDAKEFAAAISRDGKFVAFLSDRDGPVDVWITKLGSGQFRNVTRGTVPELVNPSVRTVGFSPDGASVLFWMRRPGATGANDISIWSVPNWAQDPQLFLDGVAEASWSNAGTSLVYHTPGPGDPTFVRNLANGADHRILVAPSGLHAHFPVWSPDDSFIYVVLGAVPDAMDIWRIKSTGGAPERLTFHNARVSHPVFLNHSTIAYLVTTADGSGPRIYGLDLASHRTHRLSVGLEEYTSLSATGDGRKLVATVARFKGSVWRVPIAEEVVTIAAAQPIVLPAARALSPRLGPGYVLFVSSNDTGETIVKVADGRTTELWNAPGARIVGVPAISPDGSRITFAAEQNGKARLFIMNGDGSNVSAVPNIHEPRGAPAWSPDGRSIAIAQLVDGSPRIVRVEASGRAISPLVPEYSIDPAWSPDGRVLIYSGADIGTNFQLKSLSLDGSSGAVINLTLTRGERRVRFMPGGRALIVLKGGIEHKDFWLLDLDTGVERQITAFEPGVHVRDFDVSRDGREIVFDRIEETSDLVLVDIPEAR